MSKQTYFLLAPPHSGLRVRGTCGAEGRVTDRGTYGPGGEPAHLEGLRVLTVGKGEKITSQHKISNRELCPGEEMEVKHFQVAQPRVLPHQEVLLQGVFC